MIANGNLNYLYTRLKFGWDEADFAQYNAASTAVHTLAMLAAVSCFTLRLGLRDTTVGAMAAASGAAASIVKATAPQWWIYCLSKLAIGELCFMSYCYNLYLYLYLYIVL